MAAYVIAQMTVHDIDMYYDYASKIAPTAQGFGGKILAANDAEVREGSLPVPANDRRRVPDAGAGAGVVRVRRLSGDHRAAAERD